MHDGVERCFSRISEAGTKLGSMAEDLLPHHNWEAIRDIGNILRHEYDNVDDKAIWLIVTKKVLPLLQDIEIVMHQLPDDT